MEIGSQVESVRSMIRHGAYNNHAMNRKRLGCLQVMLQQIHEPSFDTVTFVRTLHAWRLDGFLLCSQWTMNLCYCPCSKALRANAPLQHYQRGDERVTANLSTCIVLLLLLLPLCAHGANTWYGCLDPAQLETTWSAVRLIA